MAEDRRSLAGELPSIASLKVWGGFGTGKPCDACGEPIQPSQLEHEVGLYDDETTNFRFHIGCGSLWEAELKRRGVA